MNIKKSQGLTKPLFKVGDRVIHKLSGLKMTIKKLSDRIAVCDRDEPWFYKWDDNPHFTAICLLENLEHDANKL